MRLATLLLLTGTVLIAARTSAIDLENIPRQIDKLPELKSDQPLYCLLVFGPEAKTRVWLVRDGDVLYVDRNGNGDLTDEGERIAMRDEASDSRGGSPSFLAGDIPDGQLLHKALRVHWINVDHLLGKYADVTERLEQDPNFRAVSIACDVELPGYRGQGIDGRVVQHLSIGDVYGLLDFAQSPAEAPILHFGGPWTLLPTGKGKLRLGRNNEISLEMGTPGIGPGSTISTAYAGVIPAEVRPRVEFQFPKAGGETLVRTYNFDRRCCTYNLYDDVVIPDEVTPGMARVTFSLASWPEGNVAPSTFDLELLPALPGPQILPVSRRLVSKLEHLHPDGEICDIHFSPDGQKLIAGDYPGGLVHIWNLATGERVISVDAGEGLRGSHNYFHISPDWQQVYTHSRERGRLDHIERDGKRISRVAYSDVVNAWDAVTGHHLHAWQQDPPRRVVHTELLPDGKHMFVQEETPGEVTGSRPRALSLLDVQTGTFREVAKGWISVHAVNDDSTLAGVAVPIPGETNYTEAIVFYTLPDWQPTTRVPLVDLQRAFVTNFAKEGQVAIGVVITMPKRDDFKHSRQELKIWEVSSGKELLAIEPQSPREAFLFPGVSPDGGVLALAGFDGETRDSRLLLVDLVTWQVRETALGPNTWVTGFAFEPSGRNLATAEAIYPKQVRRNLKASELEQPRIQLIDVASGKVLETMIAPQSFQMSIAYSPDGKTLATGGEGAVPLWDMTVPPGELAPPPEVGQTLELAGTKVDGQPLDPAAYHGKVTLVSFWATWCQPCVAELPELKSLYHDLHEHGFEVVGVSLDEADTDLKSFVRNQSIPWSVLHGATPETAGMHHPLARRLGVSSVPRSFLLDGEGKIVAIDPPLHEIKSLVEAGIRQADPNQ